MWNVSTKFPNIQWGERDLEILELQTKKIEKIEILDLLEKFQS